METILFEHKKQSKFDIKFTTKKYVQFVKLFENILNKKQKEFDKSHSQTKKAIDISTQTQQLIDQLKQDVDIKKFEINKRKQENEETGYKIKEE